MAAVQFRLLDNMNLSNLPCYTICKVLLKTQSQDDASADKTLYALHYRQRPALFASSAEQPAMAALLRLDWNA